MAKSNCDPSAERSAAELAGWIDAHLGLLRGLVELRELGPQSAQAIRSVLEVKELSTMAASWRLWEELADTAGTDVEAVLTSQIPPSRLELARRALWGSPDDRDDERLVRGHRDGDDGDEAEAPRTIVTMYLDELEWAVEHVQAAQTLGLGVRLENCWRPSLTHEGCTEEEWVVTLTDDLPYTTVWD